MGNSKKHILILLILFLICFSLIWWVVKPALAKIKESNQEINFQKQKLAQLLQEGQSVIESQKTLSIIEAGINEVGKVWLRVGDELKFITDLEQAATDNNLEQVISFDNTDYKGETTIKMIPITLQVKGELDDIMAYINRLEAFDYYINIDKVEINTYAGKTSKSFSPEIIDGEETEPAKPVITLSVSLDGLTYWK
jgi:Tfp pilus assembly protein PilO